MSTAKKLYGFEPDYAIPPGETLKEVMESLNMAQKELAVRTGLTVQSLNSIFKDYWSWSFRTPPCGQTQYKNAVLFCKRAKDHCCARN